VVRDVDIPRLAATRRTGAFVPDVRSVRGGTSAWAASGSPLVTGPWAEAA
jgi:hypothetical protein